MKNSDEYVQRFCHVLFDDSPCICNEFTDFNQPASPSTESKYSSSQLRDIMRAFYMFNTRLKELNYVIFSDMLSLGYQLLSTNKSVLMQLQSYYVDFFVDEFQDTNGYS